MKSVGPISRLRMQLSRDLGSAAKSYELRGETVMKKIVLSVFGFFVRHMAEAGPLIGTRRAGGL